MLTKDTLRCPFCGDVLELEPDGGFICLRCGCMVLPGDDNEDKFAGWESCLEADVKRRPAKRGNSGASSGGKRQKKLVKPVTSERYKLE